MRLRFPLPLVGVAVCVAAIAATAAGAAVTTDYSNNSGVSIPDTSLASPYPSAITVSGNPGVVSNVTVTLHDLTHTCSSDLNIMLEAPNGSTTWLAAQSGACAGTFGGDVTFDDAASADWTYGDTAGGTYRPTQDPTRKNIGSCEWTDSMPGGAPTGPYGTTLSALDGSTADGTWRLYIQDNCGGDSGAISGWTLHLTTSDTASVENGIFLCYSKFQVDPGVWGVTTAKSLLAEGDYWLPHAIAGNPARSQTILGDYSLVCNLPGSYADTGRAVDDGGTVWDKSYVQSQDSLSGLYAIYAPS